LFASFYTYSIQLFNLKVNRKWAILVGSPKP
jgi:hypothetical protein